MNSLYIIGNGFDLAHGIDTRYWSFRTFLEENHWEFLQRFENLYGIQHLDESEYGYSEEAQERWNTRVNKELWSEFERFMATPDIQSMLDYSSSVVGDLDLDSGNNGIRGTMDDYWKREFGFIKNLQEYVKEWIEQIDISGVTPKKQTLVDNDSDYFFNFNYTRVLEDVYHIEKVVHIHGTIGDDADYDPVMGHCNSAEIEARRQFAYTAEENYDEGEASIQEAVSDYLNEIYKDTAFYKDVNEYFFECLHTVNNVKIIGWSAGDVDIPYLLKIKESICKDAQWTVYYYDSGAYNSLSKALSECGILDTFVVDFKETRTFWDR